MSEVGQSAGSVLWALRLAHPRPALAVLGGLTLPDTLLVRADTHGGLDHADDLDGLQVLTDFL